MLYTLAKIKVTFLTFEILWSINLNIALHKYIIKHSLVILNLF